MSSKRMEYPQEMDNPSYNKDIPKKLSFEEWWEINSELIQFEEWPEEAIWKAAQENK